MTSLINTFFELVKIDSPTGKEEKVALYIISFLEHQDFDVERDDYGNVYAHISGKGEPIFFSAHLDTVEPGRGINPKIDGEFIVSDGTTILGSDDKVGISAILDAVSHLPKNHRPIELVFTLSEEIGNYGAINLDYSLLQAKRGYCFDLSQPVGTIAVASPFYERFDIKLIGLSAHASHPEEALNVLPALAEILEISPLGKVDENTFFNIGVVHGGDVRNTILGEIYLKGEIRSFVGDGINDTKTLFRKNVMSIANKYGLEIEEDWVLENPGYKHISKESQAFIKETEDVIKEIGLKPLITQTAGVSDANIFNVKELICLNLGDGSEFSHTTKERVKIPELENLSKLITALARS